MKLRKFKKWSPRRVEEVVRMLYEKQRFDIDKSPRHWRELKWKELVRRACQYLDEVDEAYAEIAKERAKMDAEYRGAEARAAEAEAEAEDLPDPVPVEKALRVITGRDRTTLAESNFASGGSAAAFRSARRWNCERSTSRSGRASKGDRAT